MTLALFIEEQRQQIENLPPTVENVAIKYRSFIVLRSSALC